MRNFLFSSIGTASRKRSNRSNSFVVIIHNSPFNIFAGDECKNCNRIARVFAQKEIKSLLSNCCVLQLYDGKLGNTMITAM